MSRPAAFLDRDGTLNVRPAEHRHVGSAEAFRWLPGAAEGAARLARAGYTLVVVSNQRGVALGTVTPAALAAIEEVVQSGLEPHGARIASFRYCPHDLEPPCDCRKPAPGLLLAAADELGLDLAASWMIGDAPSDVGAGRAAGCRTALVGGDTDDAADLHAESLEAASRLIVAPERSRAA